MARKKKKYFSIWLAGAFMLSLVGFGGYFMFRKEHMPEIHPPVPAMTAELSRTFENYREVLLPLAADHAVSASYLMALISLETSGFHPPRSRFEKGVYAKLKAVQSGERRAFEQIKGKHLQGISDDGLRNLASSWGPFQIMGYKCFAMDLQVHDLRGSNALENGIRWVDEEYGRLLRKERFVDCFHIHNTGRKMPRNGKPRTHDPKYVEKGLSYMKYFDARIQSGR